jgi:FkbM family methyltransferase
MKTNNYTIDFPEGFDYVAQDIKKYGVWEKRTTDFVKEYLKEGMLFLDVGSQAGYYTLLASQLGAKVYAFEPSTSNRELLNKNIESNGYKNITVFDVALSDKVGKEKLYNGKTCGENSLFGEGNFEMVQTERYDGLGLETPDMIKIDIEGAEIYALKGMKKVLETDKPLILILEDWYNKVTDWLIDNYGFELVTTDRGYGNRILVKNRKIPFVQEPIRFHLLGTYNTPCNLKPEGIGNAFASKVVRMAKILKSLGHYVIFYGVEGSEVECDEFVQVSTKQILENTYGPWNKERVYGCGWHDLAHSTFNAFAIAGINERKRFGDFLMVSFGVNQKEIVEAVKIDNTVEIGIGYTNSFAPYRIFESYFQMNWSYGAEGIWDGRWYDTVIQGYFEESDFTYNENKEDYFLYLGRIIQRKGVLIARDVCKKLGKKLIVAGFGHIGPNDDRIDKATFYEIKNDPNVEYVGFADLEKRKELMSKAKAVFMPTTYLEAFGYVAIEAMFSGTPVITTDFGAFSETIQHGKTGYRCKTFEQFLWSAKNIDNIKPADCRKWATDNFSMKKAEKMYQEYFDQILNLYGKGWYKENPDRKELDYLNKIY